MRIGNRPIRFVNVSVCWRARTVVGTTTTTCFPSLDRLERRADSDLRLAEPDVTAHQAVHRGGLLHVLLDRVDRGCLVGRLLELERGL